MLHDDLTKVCGLGDVCGWGECVTERAKSKRERESLLRGNRFKSTFFISVPFSFSYIYKIHTELIVLHIST